MEHCITPLSDLTAGSPSNASQHGPPEGTSGPKGSRDRPQKTETNTVWHVLQLPGKRMPAEVSESRPSRKGMDW